MIAATDPVTHSSTRGLRCTPEEWVSLIVGLLALFPVATAAARALLRV